MNSIVLKVEGRHIVLQSGKSPIQGEVNASKVTASFDSEWDGLDITVTFKGVGEAVTDEYSQSGVLIPSQTLTHSGNLYIGFEGRSNGVLVIRTATMDPIPIEDGKPYDGVSPRPESKDLLRKMLDAKEACEDATEGAENVNATLSGTTLTVTNRNGVSTSVDTKGPTGETGPKGDPGEDGSQVSVSATGTSTDEVSYITIDGVEKKLAGGGGGTSDHSQLTNRDASNQHPISAINGLQSALDAKLPKSGGTMTGPITLAGGDGHGILMPTTANINVEGTENTVLGFYNGNYLIGHVSYNTNIRGSGTKPKYNGNDMAMASDVPTKTSDLDNDSGFLTQHQSLAAYRTSAAQDVIDAGKMDVQNGTTNPNEYTVGTNGSMYYNTSNGKLFRCMGFQPAQYMDITNGTDSIRVYMKFDMAYKDALESDGITVPSTGIVPDGVQGWDFYAGVRGGDMQVHPCKSGVYMSRCHIYPTSVGGTIHIAQYAHWNGTSWYDATSNNYGFSYSTITGSSFVWAINGSREEPIELTDGAPYYHNYGSIFNGTFTPSSYGQAQGYSATSYGEGYAWTEVAYADNVPTKTSDLDNDSGFLTSHQSLAAYRTASQQDVVDNEKQDKSNLVTSVSSTSTDAQYPSAKCLYDMCGNIESLLEGVL